MTTRLVVVSGLPASGKTTLGAALSERLGMPLLDKDTILEALFDSLGCPDRSERHRLSRASDEVLYALAGAMPAAVVVNWWDHGLAPTRLHGIASLVVEVFCECPVEVAAARFEARRRHSGHHDPRRTPEEIAEGVQRMRDTFPGPLGLGDVVRVDTTQRIDTDQLTRQVLSRFDALLPPA